MAALKNATCSNKSGTQGEFVLVFNFRHTFAWNLGEISKVSWPFSLQCSLKDEM